MKRIKRIIAVIILCAVLLLVGYSCYTGSQLTGAPKEMYGYKNTTFHTSDGEPYIVKAWGNVQIFGKIHNENRRKDSL